MTMSNKEWEEQALIAKNGIHPYPWEAKVNEDVGWYVTDSNDNIVIIGPLKRGVAKAIVESYNRYPIVILEDDVVY